MFRAGQKEGQDKDCGIDGERDELIVDWRHCFVDRYKDEVSQVGAQSQQDDVDCCEHIHKQGTLAKLLIHWASERSQVLNQTTEQIPQQTLEISNFRLFNLASKE